MRHQMANRKLGRTSSHRAAMFRNQINSMIQNERIVTTLIKAKELRPIFEKMITLGKEDSVHNRRQAAKSINDNQLIQKLFTNIAPRFAERPGGYTRIIKLGPRRGDGAEMAILELVDYTLASDSAAAPAKGGAKKAAAKPAAKPAAKKEEKKAPAAEDAPKKRAAKAKKDEGKTAGVEKPKRVAKKKEDAKK